MVDDGNVESRYTRDDEVDASRNTRVDGGWSRRRVVGGGDDTVAVLSMKSSIAIVMVMVPRVVRSSLSLSCHVLYGGRGPSTRERGSRRERRERRAQRNVARWLNWAVGRGSVATDT
jgi:hypothetical protein